MFQCSWENVKLSLNSDRMWKLEVESGTLIPTIGDLAYVVPGAVAMHLCQLSMKTKVSLLLILVAHGYYFTIYSSFFSSI